MEKNYIKTIPLSICISVHNTGHLLRRCLDSVINQTLDGIEIVLVNNGSTDDSEDIMYEYKQKFVEKRIIIVSQEDRGLAQGRQTGVNNAHGDYIAFLDADDYVKPNAYKLAYDTALSNHVDIVEFETIREGKIISSPYTGLWQSHSILADYFLKSSLSTMLWMRIYKRSLFSKPVFPSLYTNNEDNFALPCLLYSASSIYFLKKHLHYYTTDNENATMKTYKNGSEYGGKLYNNQVKAMNSIQFIRSYMGNGFCEFAEIYPHFLSRMVANFLVYKHKNSTFDKKLGTILPALEFSDKKSLTAYVEENIKPTSLLYRLIKIFGLRIGCKIYKIIK